MNKKLLIFLILGIILTRFIGLASLPPALNRDEAAIGYNAYSILKTGKDEHGQSFPLNFKSIGDYKMPLYIYATIIPVALFGLNDFSIRFWSALAGGISIFALYFLIKQLLHPSKLPVKQINLIATISSILMLFNLWAVFYSRIAFEANLALALFLTATVLITKKTKNQLYHYLGLILYLLASLTYSSALIFLPPFLLMFIFLNRKSQLKPAKRISWLIFFVLFIFIFFSLWSISSQKSAISIFSNPTLIDHYNQLRTASFAKNPLYTRLWLNKPFYLFRLALTNYFKTFSPSFLFLVGGNHAWHRIPHLGNFYLVEIILIFFGAYYLLKKLSHRPTQILLFSWLLLSPISSAITIDAPHATRSLHLLPVMLILASLGVVYLYQLLKNKKLVFVFICLYLLNLTYATYHYLVTYPRKFPESIPIGLKQALLSTDLDNNTTIYLTDTSASTYLYPAVYYQYDPNLFQAQAQWVGEDLLGLSNVFQFGQFHIIDSLNDIVKPATVILKRDTKSLFSPQEIIYENDYYQIYSVK